MNLKDLGAQIAAEHPQLNARVIDKVLRAAFTALRTELESTTESTVKCGPLGTFKLQDKAPKEGEAAAAKQRRIVLRLSAAKAQGDTKAGKATKAGKKAGKTPVDEATRAERKAARQAAKASKKDTTPDAAN
jgi:nucleoid DNA-binding protein